MTEFKERYGLSFLRKEKKTEAEQQVAGRDLPLGMEEALIAHGRKVLETLKSEPENASRIFDISKRLTIRIDTLLPVVKYLLSKGYLVRILEDPMGNDTLKLSESGTKLLD